VPTSTDLVKDGAVAIETLGDSIDASLLDLKGGTTGQVLAKASGTDMDFSWVAIDPLVILDAKGDLITATAADTPARLAVGTNGQTLVADSTAATGLKWATPASGGGMTLLHTITLSTTSHTQSSISQAYKNLVVFGQNLGASSGAAFRFRVNGRTSNYEYTSTNLGVIKEGADGGFDGETNDLSANGSACQFTVYDYAETNSEKLVTGQTVGNNTSAVTNIFGSPFNSQTNVTNLTFTTVAGTANLSGTILIYGVS
jgi:hypothetical protein